MYDYSLPHSRLATSDVEGERRTRAHISLSRSSPCSRLLLDCTSDLLISIKWIVKSSPAAVTW
ncbi:unnamed protein product [Spirodela intermedia]|uniref:Uncharacterized protein n=1 Tax=Spirodela intermedia TaxID=51605 RepID=A0A7I8L5Y7_SPIIN|nr:unnamed protein product [Spirodela intermedia]